MTTQTLHIVTDNINPDVVSALLALRRVNKTELADVLQVHPSQVGRRLAGDIEWSAKDVKRVADYLSVEFSVLYLPTSEFLERLSIPKRELPPDGGIHQGGDDGSWAPRGSNSRPMDSMFVHLVAA